MRSSATLPKLHPVAFQLSPGEIHFLWWFIQGSRLLTGRILGPETGVPHEKAPQHFAHCIRHRLRRINYRQTLEST
jgi:hypothetical protein